MKEVWVTSTIAALSENNCNGRHNQPTAILFYQNGNSATNLLANVSC
jgi:hypothetical protein